ncbi:MAG: IclR family transcriptional regulator [Hyphomicrobiaceae bacterium]
MRDADERTEVQPEAEPVFGGKERTGVQSIERAFAILEEVARRRDGVRLAELARSLGLHTSTTFHLVKTMVKLGYLRQVSEDKTYRIGTLLFRLAGSALDDVEMSGLAAPVLERLSAATGETSHFAIRSGDDVIVLARTVGSGAFQLADRVGAVRPAHATALGKILLSGLEEDQLLAYLERRPPTALTPRTITDTQLLVHEIRVVGSKGIAYDDGEFNTEARCVAVPVRDFTGRIIGAIGISGAVWRLSLQALNEKTMHVQAAAGQLSVAFGYSGDAAATQLEARQEIPASRTATRRRRAAPQ